MSGRVMGAFALVAIGLAALALVFLRAPASHRANPPAPEAEAEVADGVSANGFTLVSRPVELPTDEAAFPAGPHVDAMIGNCAACHSPSMILSQPALSADQWKAEVTKMREVYKAPVAAAAVPAILEYLNALTASQGKPATAKAQDPAPAAPPKIG